MSQENNGGKTTDQGTDDTKVITNFEMMQRVREMAELETVRVESFPLLSKYIDGFRMGELVVVTGPTRCGKTLVLNAFTKDLSNDGHFPLWFTYEMPVREFLSQRFPRNSEDLNFFLPEQLKPYSLPWIDRVIRRSKDEYGTDFVFIDHLHYVYDMSNLRNSSLEIGYIVRQLKSLAVELEVVIFLVCHTTKALVTDADEVGLHSIRDSSFVAQEADTVLYMIRDVEDHGICNTDEAAIKICKARRTGEMHRSIRVVKDGFYLREV